MADEDPRLSLVYAEALRSITQQQGVLDQLRANVGTLLGAVSLATGFLAGLDGRKGFGRWGWVATGAFIVAVIAVVSILWPRHKWRFRMNTETLVDGYVDAKRPATLNEMHRALAGFLGARLPREPRPSSMDVLHLRGRDRGDRVRDRVVDHRPEESVNA